MLGSDCGVGLLPSSAMTNEMAVPETQVEAKEAIQMDDPKPCISLSPAEEMPYCATVHPAESANIPELLYGEQQLVMLSADQAAAMPLSDMAVFEGMTNVVSATHLAGPHMHSAHSQGSPYYQILSPPSYYPQGHHYAAASAPVATAHPADQSAVIQPYVQPTTVMYVRLPASYQEALQQAAAMRYQPAMQPAAVAYQQVPVEFAPAAIPVQHQQQQQQLQQQQQQPPPQQQPQQQQQAPNPQSRSFMPFAPNYARPSSRQRIVILCQFCQNNKEPEEFFRSHTLRDATGRVICPVLRAYNCPLCNNGGGDKAHTKSYCPQLRNRHPPNGLASHSGRRGHNNNNNNSHPNHHRQHNHHLNQFQLDDGSHQRQLRGHSRQHQANAAGTEEASQHAI